MLFSSGWGLADVESYLHLLVSSLQQQPRSFFHLAAIRIQHRPKPLVTNSIYLPPLRTSMTSPTITLWTPLIGRVLFGRPVCCRDQVTKLFPVFLLRGNQDFLCGFSRNISDDRIGVVWPWLELIPHPSSLATQLLLTRKPKPHHYIPIHFTDSLIGYNICYYVTFVAVVTSNVKAKRCYEDGCIRHRTPTPAKTPASHPPPLRRVLQPGELLLKLNSDRRTMRY